MNMCGRERTLNVEGIGTVRGIWLGSFIRPRAFLDSGRARIAATFRGGRCEGRDVTGVLTDCFVRMNRPA